MRKLTILFSALMLVGTQLFAEDIEVEVGKIKYRINTETSTAVKVTKGDKTVTLYAPESVDYIVK